MSHSVGPPSVLRILSRSSSDNLLGEFVNLLGEMTWHDYNYLGEFCPMITIPIINATCRVLVY